MCLLSLDQGPPPFRKQNKTKEMSKERCQRGLWVKDATSLPASDGEERDERQEPRPGSTLFWTDFQGRSFSTFYDQVGDGEEEGEEDGEQQGTKN